MKIYSSDENFTFELKEYSAAHILELMKIISTEYIGKKYDTILTLII